MKLEIITPDKTMYSGEVNLIQLPGLDGSLEILQNHAPLISVLKKGNIRIKNASDKEELFEVNGGVVEVLNNKVLILAE